MRTNREWQQTLRLLPGDAIEVVAQTVRVGVDSGDLPADLDVRTASSALFGVGLVVAVAWLVFQPDRPISDVQESLSGIVRRVARTESGVVCRRRKCVEPWWPDGQAGVTAFTTPSPEGPTHAPAP